MILLLDTSTSLCRAVFIDGDEMRRKEWEAGRELSDGILDFLQTGLEDKGLSWQHLTGIGVFQGPGSFTGLRIGITVLNTLADSLDIPIVGTIGDDWQTEAVSRLLSGENDMLILPYYGSDANITKPRK